MFYKDSLSFSLPSDMGTALSIAYTPINQNALLSSPSIPSPLQIQTLSDTSSEAPPQLSVITYILPSINYPLVSTDRLVIFMSGYASFVFNNITVEERTQLRNSLVDILSRSSNPPLTFSITIQQFTFTLNLYIYPDESHHKTVCMIVSLQKAQLTNF